MAEEYTGEVIQGPKEYTGPVVTPKAEQPQEGSAMQRILGGAARFASAGPIGMVLGAGHEIMGESQKALDKAGYEAGGLATDAATKVGATPETAAAIGSGTNVALSQGVPMVLGGEVAKLASPAFAGQARSLMYKALKPSHEEMATGRGEKAVQTMLEEGINVTEGGVEKLRGKINVLNDKIATEIAGSNAKVNKKAVASRIDDVIKDIRETHETSQDPLKKVEQIYNKFVNNGDIPAEIPVQRAQKIKQAIYKRLEKEYEKVSQSTEQVGARKAIARGMKEEIAAKVPGVQELNAQESRLLNALEPAEREVGRAMVRDPGGLAWLATSPEKFAAFVAGRSPGFKSFIANIMYKGQEQIPANVARVGIGARSLSDQQ